MDRPHTLSNSSIPMVAAVSLDNFQDLIDYAENLEDKIIAFSEAWTECNPYATTQEAVDTYRDTLRALVKFGQQLQKEKSHDD